MFLKRIFCFVFLITTLQNTSVFGQNSRSSNTEFTMHSKLIQPPYLKAGDSVAIVAPSGVLNNREKEVHLAKKLLESWGLNVVIGEHVFKNANHFAGTDDERAEDFQNALDNPNIRAIWSARGGYGTVRVLDKLDYSKFKNYPKWVIGYSDITALHNQIHNEGVETIHAMMCTSITDDKSEIEETIETFRCAIFGKDLSYEIASNTHNKKGIANGQLVGGNLTILNTMLGSKTTINTDGKILFFEETGEYKYHIDRMLQSLKRAGYFDSCAGVIVGNMSKMRKNTPPWGTSIEKLVLDTLAEYDFPILFDFPAGHEDDNRALILGRTVSLNVAHEQSTVVFED